MLEIQQQQQVLDEYWSGIGGLSFASTA